MVIFNAKQSTLSFKLDNGEILKVKPGESSKPFVPSLIQLQSILALGTPSEIAIILSSSYEMDLLRQLTGTMAYIKKSAQHAKDELLDGKVIEEPDANVNVEAVKLAEQLKQKCDEVKILEESVKDLTSKLANSPAAELQSKLQAANDELIRANNTVAELQSKIDTLNTTITDKDKELESTNAENNSLAAELADANKRLLESVNADNANSELADKLAKAENHITELEAASQYAVSKSDYDDLNAKFEAVSKENEQLKADAKTIVDKYNQAKNTLTSVMEKFGITYNGTEFVLANTQS